MTITIFDNDDRAYLKWLSSHPEGFVVNGRRKFDPDYLVLHRATCGSVNVFRGMEEKPGGFTERNYVKLCGESISSLERHLGYFTGSSQPFSKECSACKPR